MQVQSYLFFDGKCEEALTFYQKAIGAKVEAMMRYKDSPEPPKEGCMAPSVTPDKIMHSCFKVGDTSVMASDGMCGGKPNFQGFSMSLIAKDPTEAETLFKNLGEGGQVQMPLTKTFFSPSFGMVADKFGVSWMVVVM